MRVVYSNITYTEAEEFLEQMKKDRKEEFSKNSRTFTKILCGLALSIFAGFVWAKKVYPDVMQICGNIGKEETNILIAVSLLVTIAFVASVLFVLWKVLLRHIFSKALPYMLQGVDVGFNEPFEKILDALQFQNHFKEEVQDGRDDSYDIHGNQLVLQRKAEEGLYFEAMELSGEQRSRILSEGVLDFSGLDKEWNELVDVFS